MQALLVADSIESKITARITELETAERSTIIQLTVIQNLLSELRGLVAPIAEPQLSGSPLSELEP